ncbi:MAG: 3-isopropylmalate dehydratase small subunit [Pontixanthobacter sp.]
MEPVTTIEGRAIPFGAKNVDTDVIIPAEWLKTITREGLGQGAFETIRAQDGNIFDDPEYTGAAILIAGDNFGCGSSREHAAWALLDMGITAVIAPSFSDIFAGNAFKNGILTVALPQEQIDRLMEVAKTDPISIDLETQTVTTPFQDRFAFDVDTFRKHCLAEGLDEVGLTLKRGDAITEYEKRQAEHMPWFAKGTEIAA